MDASTPSPETTKTAKPFGALELLAFGFALVGMVAAYAAVLQFRIVFPALAQHANPQAESVVASTSIGETLVVALFLVQAAVVPVLYLLAALGIWLQRWYLLALTACGAVCMVSAIGPILGVFGLLVLLQPGYRSRFPDSTEIPGSKWWGGSPARTAAFLRGAFLLSAVYLLVLQIPDALFRYLHASRNLMAQSRSWDELVKILLSPDASLEGLAQQVWIPAILSLFALAAALLLHIRSHPRSLIAAAFLHAGAFPLGTIAGLLTLLWLQDPTGRALFPPNPAKELEAIPESALTEEDAERFRKSMGMH
jgi:hypothetical protein